MCLQKCYVDMELSNAAQRRLELELSSTESEKRLAVTEYRQRIEELTIELRTLQVIVEEQRGCSDEAARLAMALEKEKGRLAGRWKIMSHNCIFIKTLLLLVCASVGMFSQYHSQVIGWKDSSPK